jgi:hypothetical protein
VFDCGVGVVVLGSAHIHLSVRVGGFEQWSH